MVESCFDPHLSRVKAGEITPVSIEKVRRGCGYQIYGYRCYRVTFSDGTTFSTSNWMYPDTLRTLRRLEEAFGITYTKEKATA
jgi:hypothetical protein